MKRSPKSTTAWQVIAMAVIVACGSEAEPVPDPGGDELLTVDLGIRPFLHNAPVYIALEEGYFAQEGLDVRVHILSGHSATALVLLEHGDIDVLTGSIFLGLFNAVNDGAGIRIVGDTGYFEPNACSPYSLVVRKELAGQLRSPASLRGLQIDVNPSLSEGYFVETYLKRDRLSLEDVNVRAVPLPSRQDAMNRGAIDLTAISEPWLSRILSDGHEVVVGAGDVVPGLQYGTLLFGPGLLGERREAGLRFVAGYLRGVQQYNRGKTPRNIEILSRTIELDATTLEKACWPSVREDGMIETEAIQEFQRWGLEKGLVDRVVDPEEYWDPSFVIDARPGGAAP